jgi:hypothetical protein
MSRLDYCFWYTQNGKTRRFCRLRTSETALALAPGPFCCLFGKLGKAEYDGFDQFCRELVVDCTRFARN